jgi:FKBP-type peptidyl-prolyl cis-trans isomerase
MSVMARRATIVLVVAMLLVGCERTHEAGGSVASGGAPGTQADGTVATASGLRYIDLKVGAGATPRPGQIVIVHYTGWRADGFKFDSSRDRGQAFQFRLGAGHVIKGFDEGIATMKVGGRRRLIVPPALAYGEAGTPDLIPPNATLTFEVELLAVQ